jgi:hypothetical protein
VSVCIEILKWKGKGDVADNEMIQAVDNMVSDLRDCEGFLHQSLYKINEMWCDVYYWEDERCAINSNTIMANKDSLIKLLALIEDGSITMEVATALQSSGDLSLEVIR